MLFNNVVRFILHLVSLLSKQTNKPIINLFTVRSQPLPIHCSSNLKPLTSNCYEIISIQKTNEDDRHLVNIWQQHIKSIWMCWNVIRLDSFFFSFLFEEKNLFNLIDWKEKKRKLRKLLLFACSSSFFYFKKSRKPQIQKRKRKC